MLTKIIIIEAYIRQYNLYIQNIMRIDDHNFALKTVIANDYMISAYTSQCNAGNGLYN